MCATPKTYCKKLHRPQKQGMKMKLSNSLESKQLKQLRHRKREVTFCSKVIVVDSEDHKKNPIGSTVVSKNNNQQTRNNRTDITFSHDHHDSQSGAQQAAYDTWYSVAELEDIKEGVKEEAKKYRTLSNKAISSSPTQSSLVLPFHNCGVYKKMKYLVKVQEILNDGDDNNSNKHIPEFRGLEGRIFVERQRNKTMAMNTIMEYQRRSQILINEAHKNKKSEADIQSMKEQFATRLSTICNQLSQWALDEALAAARYDAEGVFALPSSSSSSLHSHRKTNDEKRSTSRPLPSSTTTSLSSYKRKLSAISPNVHNNLSIWEQHQRQMKQPRLSKIDNMNSYNNTPRYEQKIL